MNLQMIKIGGVVMVMALVTYVFFPANAELAKQGKASTQINAAPATNTPQSARAESGKPKNVQKKSSTKQMTVARRSEPPIEPEKTLRKNQKPNRSGPPSKMYGGM